MSMAQKQRGRPPIDEDTVSVFVIIGGVLLVIFFLLVIRVFLDSRAGKPLAPLKPTRSPFTQTKPRLAEPRASEI